MNDDEETTMPNLLDRARSLFTEDANEPATLEELEKRRGEVRERIGELEDRLQYLESDKGRRELLEDVDGPEELGRRKRKLRDEIAGLRDLDEELGSRQREAEAAEAAEEAEELVTRVPELADAFEEAERRLREARQELSEALVESKELASTLRRRRSGLPAKLDPDEVDRLEGLLDRIPANFSRVNGGPLGHLRSEAGDTDEGDGVVRVYDATTGETYHPGGRPGGEPQIRRAEA